MWETNNKKWKRQICREMSDMKKTKIGLQDKEWHGEGQLESGRSDALWSRKQPRSRPSRGHTHSYFSSVQWLSHVRLFAIPWITARQASLSITNSWSSLRFMSIESVMPSSHRILCCPLLLLPPIPPSIKVFSCESTLHIRWPKYWSFSFRLIYLIIGSLYPWVP